MKTKKLILNYYININPQLIFNFIKKNFLIIKIILYKIKYNFRVYQNNEYYIIE